MATTKPSDLIIPEIWNPYLIQKTTEKCAFIASGIATSDASVNIVKGAKTINIPFFQTPDATPEVLSTSAALTVNKMTADKDIACVHARGIAFESYDLSELFSGADPQAAAASYLGNLWAKDMTGLIENALTAVFGLDGMADSVLDNSANVLDANTMIDAMFLLGEHYDEITAIAMHSAVFAKLKKLDLVDDKMPSTMMLPYDTYMGKRIIIDNTLVPTSGVYPIYFFGQGAFAYNENASLITFETDRDIYASKSGFVSRRVFTMHPRGIKWVGSPAGETPTNAEYGTSTNWELVEKRENVRLACLKTKIA